jgi:hypothetical protein
MAKNKTIVDRRLAISALKRIRDLYVSLSSAFSIHGIDINEDTGRRNSMISLAQEKFFTDEIKMKTGKAHQDGSSGKPDIIHGDADHELECKITSPSKTGSVSFRVDYRTLGVKGKLDILYLIVNDAFDKFGLVHFRDITIDDLHEPSEGSREKSEIVKHRCIDRCTAIVGTFHSVNDSEISKLIAEKDRLWNEHADSISKIKQKLISDDEQRTLIEKEKLKLNSKIVDINQRIENWQLTNDKFKFTLERID